MDETLEAVIEKARRDAFPPLSVATVSEESEEERMHRSAVPAEKNTQSSTNTFTGNKNTFDSITNPHVESSRHSWMTFPPRRGVDVSEDDSSPDTPLHQYFLRVVNGNTIPDDSWKIRVGGVVVGIYTGASTEDVSFPIPIGVIVQGVAFEITFEFIESHGMGNGFIVSILDESNTVVHTFNSTAANVTVTIPL